MELKLRLKASTLNTLRWICLVPALVTPLSGTMETWTDRSGNSIEAELIAAYGSDGYFLTKKKTYVHIPIGALERECVERVVAWTIEWDKTRRSRPQVGTSDGPLAKFLKTNLQTLENGGLAPLEFAEQTEPEFYLFYFSASWCAPCRRFTPGFVQIYHGLRASGYTNFEVILVSSDESQKDMARYLRDDKMPWPALKFSKRNAREVRRYAARGIPNLVVVDRQGHILRHSYEGGKYLGPREVLNAFQAMLIASNRTDRLPIGK